MAGLWKPPAIAMPLYLRDLSRKSCFISRGTIYFNIIVIGSIPFWVLLTVRNLHLLYRLYSLNIINALFAPGFSVWHMYIPQRVRAQYFSFYRITSGIIVYTVILISSVIVDNYKIKGNELKGLIILES